MTLEAVAVLASPAVLYAVLQLRGMAPPQLPDPSMHTTFIVAPHDIFARYQAVFTPTARLREAARVGFLVPGRVLYLLFGALPGFFVFRYLLALVAIGPAYLLFRRLYGRSAGFLAIVVLMSSPVLITAWGTDYPDSAAVSYLTGGLSALALAWGSGPGRTGWILAGGALLTLAVWSHGIAVPLAGVAIGVYLLLRMIRERRGLARDLTVLLATAIVVTGGLAACSELLFGQLDFISPTLRAERFLSTPAQELLWHSSSWRWAPYDPYLLVPPAVLAAFGAVFAVRRGRLEGPHLFLGLTAALQLGLMAYLQFFGHVQGLEIHYLSSVLWASVNLLLVLTLAQMSVPLTGATAATLVLALGAGYAAIEPRLPAITWAPWGIVIGLLIGGAGLLGGGALRWFRNAVAQHAARQIAGARVLSAVALTVATGAAMVLTVAPGERHAAFARTVYDPAPAYADALGGSAAYDIDQYAVATELPRFVGHPAYRAEQLLTWWPARYATAVVEPMGIYHSSFNAVSWTFPVLGTVGAHKIESRHAAQVLLLSLTGHGFARAVRSLASYRPTVIRRGILTHGAYHLHVWLVDLGAYLRVPRVSTRS